MRGKLLVLLVFIVALSLVMVVPAAAEKPAPNLVGEMAPLHLVVQPPGVDPPLCSEDGVRDDAPVLCVCLGPDGFRGLYAWEGTITFPDGEYTIVFVNLATAKENPSGVASPFEEFWAIYDGEVALEADGCPATDHAEIWGFDKGVSNLQNNTYRMNGHVEAATGDFEGWEGRRVHMSGIIDFSNVPVLSGPGTFRLN